MAEPVYNTRMKKAAQAEGAIMSHDDYAKPTTAMTHADINAANKKLWGNLGPAASQAAAPELAGTRVGPVKVYDPTGDSQDAENTPHGPDAPHYAVASRATGKGTLLGGVKASTSTSFVKREHAERLAETNKEIHQKAGRNETEHKVVAVKPSKRSIRPEEVGDAQDAEDSSPMERVQRKEANKQKFSQRSEVGQRKLAAAYIKGGKGEGRKEAKSQLLNSNAGRVLHSDDAQDELSPTSSNPPDARGDNLLERAHGGLDAADETVNERRKNYHASTASSIGKSVKSDIQEKVDPDAAGKGATVAAHHARLSQQKKPKKVSYSELEGYVNKVHSRPSPGAKGSKDDLVEGSEAMEVEDADVEETKADIQKKIENVQRATIGNSDPSERAKASQELHRLDRIKSLTKK